MKYINRIMRFFTNQISFAIKNEKFKAMILKVYQFFQCNQESRQDKNKFGNFSKVILQSLSKFETDFDFTLFISSTILLASSEGKILNQT
jgi:hypothetical protein